jgi:hypothetical protein
MLTELQELQAELVQQSIEYQRRRELIPKIKGFPSGEALVEQMQVLSDRYFQNLVNTDPEEVGKVGWYQGAYHVLALLINEIEGEFDESESNGN